MQHPQLAESLHQTRYKDDAERHRARLLDEQRTDVYKRQVNELSRKVCVNPVPPEELHARLEAIRTAPDKLRCRLPLAYLITSGSFAVFLSLIHI